MGLDGLFTQEQQMSFLKDQAIFADTLHMRKKAVMELVKSCPDKQTVIVIVSEIIDSCPDIGDSDFKQFCIGLRTSIEERELNIASKWIRQKHNYHSSASKLV
jgi:hypothetical protein